MKKIILYYGYITQFTIDANKHPDEQTKDLYDLIKNSKEKSIIIYCNSPYIINEITVLEGYTHNNVPHPDNIKITNKHFEIMKDGSIVEGKYYESMISDENLLNDRLGESNDRFADMLDLKQKVKTNSYNGN